MKLGLVFAALLLALPAQAEVTIEWVTVSDAGNACETQSGGCFGAVSYAYRMGKYEVTNAHYTEFLNSVAATDTYGLYSTSMGAGYGGITRSGSSGSYTYSVIAGREEMPVNYVSFYSALRFANWLHNGQLTGAQDASTTEDGAYTFSGMWTAGARNADATIFLPSEDEWYKAAYYDAGLAIYYDYPAASNSQTTCALPGATANTANCDSVEGDLTDVGSYTGSPSPNGTFDQGGNLWEWNEAVGEFSFRGLRGGDFDNAPNALAASFRNANDPALDLYIVGFRVASIAEPEVLPSLSPTGVALLGGLVFGIGVVGLVIAARRALK